MTKDMVDLVSTKDSYDDHKDKLRGHWGIDFDYSDADSPASMVCSNCGEISYWDEYGPKYKYCPWCGAEMDNGGDA